MPYVSSGPLRALADDSFIDGYARAVVVACGNRLLELVTLYTPVATPGEPRARRPGTLKGSWFIGDVDLSGAVGSVEVLTLDPIACLMADARVQTREGPKRIAHVEVGDYVLTQTGEYRRVLATPRRLASEVPEMVTLRYGHTKGGKPIELKMTADHKVLIFRDGRARWLRAGDVRDGDEVFQRKPPGNQRPKKKRICEECGKAYSRVQQPMVNGERAGGGGRGQRFCTLQCRDAAWEKDHPWAGRTHAPETRVKMKAAWKVRPYMDHDWRRARPSKMELDVKAWLDGRGVEYEHQKPVGQRVVDFYLPATHEVIEADSAYYHQNQTSDVSRDRELLATLPDLTVTHLHFHDKRWPPPPDPEPLPGVHYVVCNPGPKSYACPGTFRRMAVTAEHWTYSPRPGHRGALVYDLTVEGIHSYVASQLVVSNSHVEYPTRPHLIGPRADRRAASVVETKASRGTVKDGRAALRFMVGGRVVYAREVRHPGTKGARMMGRALDQLSSEWPRLARINVDLVAAGGVRRV